MTKTSAPDDKTIVIPLLVSALGFLQVLKTRESVWKLLVEAPCPGTFQSGGPPRPTAAEIPIIEAMVASTNYEWKNNSSTTPKFPVRKDCKHRDCKVQICVIPENGAVGLIQRDVHNHPPPINGTVSPWNTFGFGAAAAPPPVVSEPVAPTSQSTTFFAQDSKPTAVGHAANEGLVLEFRQYWHELESFWTARHRLLNHPKHKFLPSTLFKALQSIRNESFKIKAKHFPFSDSVCKCTMNGRYQRCINTGALAGRKCKKGQYNIPDVGKESAKILKLYFEHNEKFPNTERDLVEHWPYLKAYVRK